MAVTRGCDPDWWFNMPEAERCQQHHWLQAGSHVSDFMQHGNSTVGVSYANSLSWFDMPRWNMPWVVVFFILFIFWEDFPVFFTVVTSDAYQEWVAALEQPFPWISLEVDLHTH